jgi:hypothetical protein
MPFWERPFPKPETFPPTHLCTKAARLKTFARASWALLYLSFEIINESPRKVFLMRVGFTGILPVSEAGSKQVAIVSWALSSASAFWPQLSPLYQTNGMNLQFTEPAPAGNKFYRLHEP